MFYDIYKTLKHKCLFNFIVGNRGCGKTYGFKEWAIDDFLKNGNQFVYIRRYKQELKKVNKFFDDISERFPETDFQVKGNTFLIDGRIAGGSMPLSTSKIEKSVPYPGVTKICFDEFILDKGVYHYLPDEVINFLEVYETIARMRDVTVMFLSNAITVTNPYFLYFDISLPYGKNYFKKNDVLIETVNNTEYIEKKKNTRFGKIINETPYGDYAIENKFLRDNKNFISKKTPNSEYYFTMLYKNKEIGVWIDYKAGLITVSENVDPSNKIIYSITNDDHSPNTMLLKSKRKSILFSNFIEQYILGNVRFESIKIKNMAYDIIKMGVL